MAKKSRIKIARSAKTGKFVTKKFAKKHPSTTVVETVIVKRAAGTPVPKAPGKKGKPKRK